MRVLLLDDDETGRDLLGLFLAQSGFEVHSASRTEEAVALASAFQPDIFIVDLLLAEASDGIDAAIEARRVCPHLRAILTTGLPQQSFADRLAGAPIHKVFTKPVDLDDLEAELKRLTESAAPSF